MNRDETRRAWHGTCMQKMRIAAHGRKRTDLHEGIMLTLILLMWRIG